MIECDTAAVVVTLRDTPRLWHAVASVREQVDGVVVVVRNDPSFTSTAWRDGVLHVGTGMNLGWAAGVHAGLTQVRSEYVWAIQDDLVMRPGAFGHLRKALAEDAGLASVRPLPLGSHDIIEAGQMGAVVGEDGAFHQPVPGVDTPAGDIDGAHVGSYLPSSGQFIRRQAWDAVGGFDPWFYPWGYIDVDFGRSLAQAGWRFAHVPAARMHHSQGASSSHPFRVLLAQRNKELFGAKWSARDAASVNPAIVAAARTGACTPRPTDLDSLRSVVGVAAADCTAFLASALGGMQARMDDLQDQLTKAQADGRAVWEEKLALLEHIDELQKGAAYLSEQAEAATSERDGVIAHWEQISRSRAWTLVNRYWRVRQRMRPGQH